MDPENHRLNLEGFQFIGYSWLALSDHKINVLRMTEWNLEHETVLVLPLIANIHSYGYVFTVLVFS